MVSIFVVCAKMLSTFVYVRFFATYVFFLFDVHAIHILDPITGNITIVVYIILIQSETCCTQLDDISSPWSPWSSVLFSFLDFLGWQNVHHCFVSFQFYQLLLQPFPLLCFAVQLVLLLFLHAFVSFLRPYLPFCQSLLFSLLLSLGFSFLMLQKNSRFYTC